MERYGPALFVVIARKWGLMVGWVVVLFEGVGLVVLGLLCVDLVVFWGSGAGGGGVRV